MKTLRILPGWPGSEMRTNGSPEVFCQKGSIVEGSGSERSPVPKIIGSKEFSRGGCRDALVHSLHLDPPVKKFHDSDRREPPASFFMIVATEGTPRPARLARVADAHERFPGGFLSKRFHC